MKPSSQFKKAIPPFAHLLRGAFYLILLVGICAIPLALAQRNASPQSAAKPGSASKGMVRAGNAAPANIIIVTNTNDSGPGSLRNALATTVDGDIIDATGVTGTILLTSGELQIITAVTITGPGDTSLSIDGNGTFRVFDNFRSGVSISGFTITNGGAPGDTGGGIFNEGGNSALLRVSDCTISGNSADFGGGIFNLNGALILDSCTITGNVAAFSGGGITNSASGAAATLTITNSTVSDNSATANDGAGIFNGAAGSVASIGSVIVSNSTLSGNSATGNGGAAANVAVAPQLARLTITNSTISDNSATASAGGVYNQGNAQFQIGETVLNAGSSGANIVNGGGGLASSLGYNLSSDDGGGVLIATGDQINTDPMLGPLQDNGGPTFTHALLPGSPAIDMGDPAFAPPPNFDQRGTGFPRVVNGRIDIGSFEVQAPGSPTPTATATTTATGTPTSTPTPTGTVSATPTATARPSPTPRIAPTPKARPTPVPRP